MSARFANDSRGNSHYLLHQEMTMSCGPACVAMVESQYKQACMIDPESRARQLSQNYPDRFTETGGTGAGNLAYVLNAEGVPCYASTGVGNKLFDYCNYYLSERTPIIAHISWASGGGHFTVLSEIDSNQRLYFLDPWYDVVEVSRSSLPNYGVAGGTLSGWLTIPHR
jgi:hypothetical protein